MKQPEPFGKSDFCKAVTGFNEIELIQIISESNIRSSRRVGRDEPRNKTDEIVDSVVTFMSSSYRLPLKPLSMNELYFQFRRFRDFEEHVHPRDKFANHAAYWNPVYDEIETAYSRNDEDGLKNGIMELVDKIIHD